ncbi:MAG: sugar ABC transporter permease [Lachnospiraceae bacterium]|nr:sugar ABC transporter permease [Lachnospiraceae bacterium]
MNKKKKKVKLFKKEYIPLFLMALPGFICLLIWRYLPMVGVIISFQNFNVVKGIFGSPFVGFRNFEFLFATTDSFVITRNTVLYNLVFIVVNMLLAVILAMMLSEIRSKNAAKLFQTVYMLPYFLSWAVVAIIANAFLDRSNGVVNHLRGQAGYTNLVDWYQRKSLWPPLIVFVNAWKEVGYRTVLYLAVISGISREYYEAAVLDGATRFQQAKYITLPHLRFIIGITLIMSMGSIMRGDFGLFYTVTQDSGPLYPVTDIIDTYIYRGLKNMSNLGMTTAAGLYQSVVGMVMILVVNAIVNKIDPDSSMF